MKCSSCEERENLGRTRSLIADTESKQGVLLQLIVSIQEAHLAQNHPCFCGEEESNEHQRSS